ncbi:PREDICTED: uncharacterized protein LOC106807901 [Priapulus caudatus]|uniref:Uncharacterized protein LOC106807901 n=1 Tax=Priapulus caudatus TaxID=37621 RepID=A0ABM1E122_PRICU|nr:PREDICTED: uncharacterized protein LOC106807901 [Priapulus caudatus]
MEGQRNDRHGWHDSRSLPTVRAILALQMTDASWLTDELDLRPQLSSKQMHIEILRDLLNSRKYSAGHLAFIINALVFSCHDPRDFYGVDFIEELTAWLPQYPSSGFSNRFQYGLVTLAMCNGEEPLSTENVTFLIDRPTAPTFGVDEAAMILMALSCVKERQPDVVTGIEDFDANFSQIVDYISSRQNASTGQFGNEHTTALAMQALTAADSDEWNCAAALDWLLSVRASDGSFGQFGTPLFTSTEVLPALNGKTYTKRHACPNAIDKSSTEKPEVQHITVKLSVVNAITGDRMFAAKFYVPVNSTVIEIIRIADGRGPRNGSTEVFTYELKEYSFGNAVQGLLGLRQDIILNRYWSLLIRAPGQDFTSAPVGIESLIPKDGEEVQFRYTQY